jgi:chitin disaccharide deacetylase
MSQNKIAVQDSVVDAPQRTDSASVDKQSTGNVHLQSAHAGCLIFNADDWGRDSATTDRIFECFRASRLSSASGMVFMEDSERAADLAAASQFDIGLHLNLDAAFTALKVPARLETHQEKVGKYLRANRFARLVYNPGLANSFEYTVSCQLEEFNRLYGRMPDRIDGHHHMHLSGNVLLRKLLPAGPILRRHFSYETGEKKVRNAIFRLYSNVATARRYRTTDFFFSLPPLSPAERLERIFSLSRRFVVEVETHPVNAEEYEFLTGGKLLRWTNEYPLAPNFGKTVALRHA